MRIYDAAISGSIQLPNFSTAPVTAPSGSLYFNTTDYYVYQYDGASWKQVGSSIGVITTGSINTRQAISGTLIISGSGDVTGTFSVGSANSRDLFVTSSGTIIGNTITDTHQRTGSMLISGSADITGTLSVGTGSARKFLVTSAGTTHGSAIGDTHIFTGSLLLSGSADITGTLSVGTGSARKLLVTSTGAILGNTANDVIRFTGSVYTTGAFNLTGSSSIYGTSSIYSSGSSLFVVDGSTGRLFQIEDSFSGSLFSVNTIAGLPIIEAFSDNTVRIGQFGQKALYVSQSAVGFGKETGLNADVDISGSLLVSGSALVSGSFGVTGSASINGGPLVLTGSALISGSFSLTGSFAAIGIPEVMDSAGQLVTSNVLIDLNGMSATAPAGSYIIDAWIYGQVNSGTAGAAFAVSSSGTVTKMEVVHSGQLSTTTFGATALQTVNNTVSTTFMTTAGAECWVHISGKVITSTGGSIFIRAVKNTSQTLIVRSGSYISATRVL